MKGKKKTLILSIETSTRGGSLAVLNGRQICAGWQGGANFSASNGLLDEIQNILLRADIKIDELDLLSAAVGPGSFTDLRIGLAVVKGLAAVLEIPVIGIPTLEAMIFNDFLLEYPIVALFPAGRAEVFAKLFRSREDNISEPMRVGNLENILTEFKSENNLRIVVPSDLRQNILAFIEREQLIKWTVAVQPENLAICVARLAFDLFEHSKSNGNSGQIIYGREAVSKKA